MIDMILNSSEWLVAAAATLTAAWLVIRKATRKFRNAARKINLASDTLLGREAVLHPETGEVLVEATPNLGMRFARMEDALVKMSDTTEAVGALTKRVDTLSQRLSLHLQQSDEGHVARMEEQKSMWDAISAIAKTTPMPEPGTTIHATVTHDDPA